MSENTKPAIKLFRGANIYAVVAERGDEEWGLGIGLDARNGDTVLEVRFAMLNQPGTKPVFKFFTDRSGSSSFRTKEGIVMGRRLNKMVIPFCSPPVPTEQFLALADQHEVWEKLESWIISAFAAEGVKLLFGIDLAKLLRERFTIDSVADDNVQFKFVMPDLMGFKQSKQEAFNGDPDDQNPGEGEDPTES